MKNLLCLALIAVACLQVSGTKICPDPRDPTIDNTCPRVFPPRNQCGEPGLPKCPGNKLCCPTLGCGLKCLKPIDNPKFCPLPKALSAGLKPCKVYHDKCECDGDCKGKRLGCCLVAGCGKRCVKKQSPKCPFPFVKIGCGPLCHSDKQCRYNQKCCLIVGCGRTCVPVGH